MIERARAFLELVLPIRRGALELALAEPPSVNDDGDPTATLRCLVREDDSVAQVVEQNVVLLNPHPDRDTRGLEAIDGWCRAIPELWARHPAVRFELALPITPDEVVASDILAQSSATTADDFAAFLLGPGSPFAWARRAAIDPAYRKLVLPPGADLRNELWSHLPDEAWSLSFEWRHLLLERWSAPARHAYYALRAISDLGGRGFEGYLEQADAAEVCGIYEALLALPSPQLAAVMRTALAKMQEQGSAEYFDAGSDRHLAAIEAWADGEVFADTWQAIDHRDDGGTYRLIASELEPAFDAFIDRHRDDLVMP